MLSGKVRSAGRKKRIETSSKEYATAKEVKSEHHSVNARRECETVGNDAGLKKCRTGGNQDKRTAGQDSNTVNLAEKPFLAVSECAGCMSTSNVVMMAVE